VFTSDDGDFNADSKKMPAAEVETVAPSTTADACQPYVQISQSFVTN
jgi:hypothetical protein